MREMSRTFCLLLIPAPLLIPKMLDKITSCSFIAISQTPQVLGHILVKKKYLKQVSQNTEPWWLSGLAR